MKIGMVGCGKLGLPLCLAMEQRGHTVIGYDVNPAVAGYVSARKIPYEEEGANEALETTRFRMVELDEVLSESEIVFVAVQTPHKHEFEGTVPITDKRVDFDYTVLRQTLADINDRLCRLDIDRTVVVISTVLPGTMRRYVMPGLSKHVRLCYSPSFIAMGTAMRDFLFPELVLFGQDSPIALEQAQKFFKTITDAPLFPTSIENAELIKVSYNTMIGMKIAFANTLMEICHKTPGTNVDAVVDALSLAKRRLISAAYLRGGMGDGGGCHPRDNIALSWLARELELSHDFFYDIMMARENQTAWLADLIIDEHRRTGYPITILGAAFKANTNITTGSPALLLAHFLKERGYEFDMIDPLVVKGRGGVTKTSVDWHTIYESVRGVGPQVFFIATAHDCWGDWVPAGSVVLDPWRKYEKMGDSRDNMADSVRYIPIGGLWPR